ncbi:cytosolic sulfotransferase 7-like [Rhododendron vialii]|uniref:cytosolic sulfotransferase 7-like n=1 Tax=Rhododendron vialii TaxID=182163 RepID=UPI00265F7F57|nr:cytosolic sulfotransferase 7-like [Rhododendron vialii]
MLELLDDGADARRVAEYVEGVILEVILHQSLCVHFENGLKFSVHWATSTTWLKALLYSVINRPSSINQLVINHSHELVPTLEMQVYGRPVDNSPPGHFPSNTSSSTSILSTHIPYQILGETLNSSDCRVVYVARNPKDTLISLWHFENAMYLGQKREPQPLDNIVSNLCEGTVVFGPFFEHVLGYQKESLERPEKFFFITYEELKSNPITHVKRLAEFLGCPFVGEDMEKQVEEVVRSCSIETLKNHEVNKSSDVPSWSMVPYDAFFRKGLVGDHMNYLTKDMIERIDAITREKFHGVNLWGEN